MPSEPKTFSFQRGLHEWARVGHQRYHCRQCGELSKTPDQRSKCPEAKQEPAR